MGGEEEIGVADEVRKQAKQHLGDVPRRLRPCDWQPISNVVDLDNKWGPRRDEKFRESISILGVAGRSDMKSRKRLASSRGRMLDRGMR